MHLNYATAYLTALGRHTEAISETRRALRSDPLSPRVNSLLGWQFLHARQHDEAIEQFGKTLKLDLDFTSAHQGLMEAYEQRNRYPEAVVAFQRLAASTDKSRKFIRSIGRAYAVEGVAGYWKKRHEDWRTNEKRDFGLNSELAIIYAQTGQKGRAFRLLAQASSDRNTRLTLLNVDGQFDPLRDDPRFDELRKQMRLPSRQTGFL